MLKLWKRQWFLIGVSGGLSLAAAAFMVPQLYVHGTFDHLCRHDPETGYQAAFALVNQWSNGGISLWERFDHLDFSYSHLATGFYTLSNVFSAALFLLCAPFLTHPAEGFYWVHVFAFNGFNLLLRTVGGYLILRRLRLHPAVIVTALVLLNSMLSMTLHLGLLTNTLYSYLPLLVYFIWCFFEERRAEYFLGAVVILTIAVASSPLFGLGYFYEVVHFFIVAALICQIPTWRSAVWRPAPRRTVLTIAAVCLLIILPSLWMFRILHADFFIAGSGLQGTQGRLNNAFQPLKYFEHPHLKDVAYLEKFLFESVNYFEGLWEGHWPWLGAGVLVWAFLGLVLSRVRAKWIFAAAILLVLLSNTPVSMHLPFGLAHWINALTNPFSFLLRTLHMPTLLAPFLYMPLAALGLQAGWELARQGQGHNQRRLVIAIVLLLAGMMFFSYQLYFYIKVYVLGVLALVLGFLYVMLNVEAPLLRRVACVLAVLGLLAMDLCAGRVYANHYLVSDYLLRPRVRPNLSDVPLLVEYQNPLHLPFREYMRTDPVGGQQILHSGQSYYGLYYKYPAFDRYFLEPSIYRPLPKVYKDAYTDAGPDGQNVVKQYLEADRRVMFLAAAGICAPDEMRAEILRRGLSRQVVVIDGKCAQLPSVLAQLPSGEMPAAPERRVSKSWRLPLAGSQAFTKDGLVEYRVDLPADFPTAMATGLFTQDQALLRMRGPDGALRPVQGKILAPYEFDINNVAPGKAAVSFPVGVAPMEVELTASLSTEIKKIWKNTQDRLGFTYAAMRDGWLVLHWPYDSKWSLSIDGQRVPIYRANKYFLATPIAAGDHAIELSYWPGSPLRILIPLSLLATIAALFFTIRWALHKVGTTPSGKETGHE